MNDQKEGSLLGALVLMICAVLGFWFLAVPIAMAIFMGAIATWPLWVCIGIGYALSQK